MQVRSMKVRVQVTVATRYTISLHTLQEVKLVAMTHGNQASRCISELL